MYSVLVLSRALLRNALAMVRWPRVPRIESLIMAWGA